MMNFLQLILENWIKKAFQMNDSKYRVRFGIINDSIKIEMKS